jgi:hypothetical protein
MGNSVFWKLLAVLGVIGLFYVGHGLHGGKAVDLPPIVAPAHASGLGALPVSPEGVGHAVYTTSADGKTLYVWGINALTGAKFVGSVRGQ